MQPYIESDGSLVITAAEALGRAIRLSPEWRDLEAARAAFEADRELMALVERYRTLSARWRAAKAEGRALSGSEAVELANLQEKIQRHTLSLRQQDAIAALVGLLQQANQVISQELGLDFAASAAPRGGGCCG